MDEKIINQVQMEQRLQSSSTSMKTATEIAPENGKITQAQNTGGTSQKHKTHSMPSVTTGEAQQVKRQEVVTGLQTGENGVPLEKSIQMANKAKEELLASFPLPFRLQENSFQKIMINPTHSKIKIIADMCNVHGIGSDDWGYEFERWDKRQLNKFTSVTGYLPVNMSNNARESLFKWIEASKGVMAGTSVINLTEMVYDAFMLYPKSKDDDYDKKKIYKLFVKKLLDLPIWALDHAFDEHIKTSKWRPTVAEIREHAENHMKFIKNTLNSVESALNDFDRMKNNEKQKHI